MVFAWFKIMISLSPDHKFSKTALFTQWASLIAYGGGGLSLLCLPKVWSAILAFEISQADEGFMRMSGIYLIALGFCYIIVARTGSCLRKQGPMLSSIFERILFVNAALLMFILRGMVPLYFATLFITLDTTLSLVTLCIWFRETSHASVTTFFKEVFGSLQSYWSFNQRSLSSLAVQIIGFLQFICGAVLFIFPTLITKALKLQHTEGKKYSFQTCWFLLISILGWFHIFAGGAELTSFAIAAVFYRASFSVPMHCLMYFCDQLELNLLLFFGSFECAFAVAVILCIILDRTKQATRIQVLRLTPEPLDNGKALNIVTNRPQ
ncbi:uncharacterized protein LOC111337193 [Stylophora pistillata]|uniref:uncharacterized protein LOC111337193 n=1 Tax=Stylophora pistillata TaxID=50429 RepID=UPI000C03D84C|nr:uncharacterized protein LOC111337193 [Stylophora pistillata]XP_022799180.1 uncharacterized protein LOC111337193 [Stylophora pistillata]